ncbi:lipid A biosynthesis acyltransferase [Hydrogenophaga crassostreae]|uniref:Lipid A biosynthesis acyltransferase n=1 Tax=Hydrogenophaga crassostreae TaxID=1763535 RepID=A0A167HEL0_9BURK|nr:lipid A biosynthesis acyltransferase [Hydrogenophaga crassostreae]AOW12130.1 lipid A biosynthesis acyltransferase [Hydrogenophaga crassostreae]OAD41075.1 lipid A biosynthesis acyltransferase [Hydrogenophaga crassostreae]
MSTPQQSTQPNPRLHTNWSGRTAVRFMNALAWLPLSWVRGLGWAVGHLLHTLAGKRRHIARTNWALCFPAQSEAERNRAVRQHFVVFTQSWLDRGWIWGASEATVRSRIKLVGDLDALSDDGAVAIFAPHFVGLDAGGAALSLAFSRNFISLYARQRNVAIDQWVRAGRLKFGSVRLVEKHESLRTLIQALRSGEALYLLPDMDLGPTDSVFVPFFGVPAATVPTLPRLAQLGRARVVSVISRLTPEGYEVTVLPAWRDYPTGDAQADTATMNQRLEEMIATMPEQYYWVHKRFKTRPPGEKPLYAR